jgi:hypothetical protein
LAKGNGFFSGVGVRVLLTWFYLSSINESGFQKGVENGSEPLAADVAQAVPL